ncbi:MAG: flagellar assembly protein FliW [Clostridiales bacterium]|jgi:flagellar assembly factor FliW|nr:flagellar assembly protein FliW [Clostridiales bacterium]
MKLTTRHFGEIEIDEEKVISFGEGLPGFPDDRRFILLEGSKDEQETQQEDSSPFYWLQSVDDGNVAFIIMDVFAVVPDYNPQINPNDISELGVYNKDTKENFLIYNIVVLPEDVKKMSVNLVAPVIINQTIKKGKQVIASNTDYNVRHYLFENVDAD